MGEIAEVKLAEKIFHFLSFIFGQLDTIDKVSCLFNCVINRTINIIISLFAGIVKVLYTLAVFVDRLVERLCILINSFDFN